MVICLIYESTCSLFTQRHFKDHLPGGVHANLQSSECRGVPKHNKLAERAFGLWDHLIRSRQNISALASEAFCLFTMNKTSKWLASMDADRRRKVTEEARKETPVMYAKFKARQEAMEEERKANIQRLKEEARLREEKQMVDLMTLAVKVDKIGGLWTSEEAVNKELEKIKEEVRGEGKGKLLDAIKTQMAYRKKVLKQPVKEARDWTYSENGRQCSVEALTLKLKIVIAQTHGLIPIPIPS